MACPNEKGLDSRHGRAHVLLVVVLLLVLTAVGIQQVWMVQASWDARDLFKAAIFRAGLPARLLAVC